MSRVGRSPIPIPQGVNITFQQNILTVKGPKGELKQKLEPGFELKTEEGQLNLIRPTEQKRHKSLHGLYRALLANMAKGVSEGFKLELELVGVGYRAEAKEQQLELSLGYSHQILFLIPPEVKVATEAVKGQNPKIILNSNDKQLIGQVAAKIRAIRPPEPYKGKGVKFVGEVIRRKAGKTSGKGGKK
jgi:large subunit ribosomal protein L6